MTYCGLRNVNPIRDDGPDGLGIRRIAGIFRLLIIGRVNLRAVNRRGGYLGSPPNEFAPVTKAQEFQNTYPSMEIPKISVNWKLLTLKAKDLNALKL